MDAYDDFLLAKQLQGVSNATLLAYEYSIRRMLKTVGRDYKDLTTSDIRKYLVGLNVGTVSLGIYVKNLKVFFRWLVDEGYREDNPMDRIANPKSSQPLPRILDEGEICRLIDAAKRNRRDTAIILLLLDTGLRASELASLSRGDVNLDDGSLLVRHGKGNKSRYVYISPTTIRALRLYLSRRKDTDPSLFLSQRGETLNRDSLRLLVYRLSQKAGLSNGTNDRRISPHTIRRTFAVMYVKQGGDPHSLQRLMGHTSIRMSELYVNLAGRDIKEAHDRYSPVTRVIQGRR